MRIVVIDPDRLTGKLLHFVLTDAGHEAVIATEANAGFTAIIGRETDAVLLETALTSPGPDGYTVCKELRARRYNGPILFVAEQRSRNDTLRAFEVGADDYLVKPFDALELLARVSAITRRYRNADYQGMGTVLKSGDAELSLGELTFRREGYPDTILTPTEMHLLECLMRNSNITISRDTLIERTWGYDFLGDSNRVDVYIRRVRKKIEADPAQPQYLHTVRGLGYVFRPPSMGQIVDLPLARDKPPLEIAHLAQRASIMHEQAHSS